MFCFVNEVSCELLCIVKLSYDEIIESASDLIIILISGLPKDFNIVFKLSYVIHFTIGHGNVSINAPEQPQKSPLISIDRFKFSPDLMTEGYTTDSKLIH